VISYYQRLSIFFRQRGVGEKSTAARWTNGIVPYVFKAGNFGMHRLSFCLLLLSYVFLFSCKEYRFFRIDAGKIAIIFGAMRRLEQSVAINNKLCVQFRPATGADKQFITIKDGAGCTSSVS
jgi:hypothetical protein